MTDPIVTPPSQAVADEGETITGVEVSADIAAGPEASAARWTLGDRIAAAWNRFRGREVVRQRITEDPDQQIRRGRARQENRWRNVYAFALLVGMGAQVWFANMYILRYSEELDFKVDPSVIIAFLGSVVVEVIGLVLVVTQSLFPRGAAETAKPND